MVMHMGKKVVCVKDIPSNLIEEAIFILKTNDKEPSAKLEQKTNEIILEEAENIISEYVLKIQKNNDSEEENLKKIKQFKFEVCYVVALFVIVCFCISTIL